LQNSCLLSAGSAVGCAATDFPCQCSQSAAIQNSALNCVVSACGAASGLQVQSSAQAVCVCLATATPPASSTTSSAAPGSSTTSSGPASTTRASSSSSYTTKPGSSTTSKPGSSTTPATTAPPTTSCSGGGSSPCLASAAAIPACGVSSHLLCSLGLLLSYISIPTLLHPHESPALDVFTSSNIKPFHLLPPIPCPSLPCPIPPIYHSCLTPPSNPASSLLPPA
jgi:hypothetical protein